MTVKLLLPVVAIFGLAACVGMPDTQTLVESGKWDELGERDGIRGMPQRSPGDLSSLAKSYQAAPSSYADYETGYLAGVDEYCNPDHAYQIGLAGTQYYGVCENQPESLRFRMEWRRGYEQYQSSARNLN